MAGAYADCMVTTEHGVPGGLGDPTAGVVEPAAGVQSVDRAISVLEILARSGEAGVSEVAAKIGVHRSTAFRLLAALEAHGLVEQVADRGKYQLGLGIVRLAGAAAARLDVARVGHAVCRQLAAGLDETVNTAILQGHAAVNVDQVRGSASVSSHNWIGQVTPLHATSSGKILLAHLDPQLRRQLVRDAGLARFTPVTITSAKALEDDLAHALERGYAVAVEEYEIGLNAIAAPVRDHHGVVVAAVSASGPAYRFTADLMHAAAADLMVACDRISHLLGYAGES